MFIFQFIVISCATFLRLLSPVITLVVASHSGHLFNHSSGGQKSQPKHPQDHTRSGDPEGASFLVSPYLSRVPSDLWCSLACRLSTPISTPSSHGLLSVYLSVVSPLLINSTKSRMTSPRTLNYICKDLFANKVTFTDKGVRTSI